MSMGRHLVLAVALVASLVLLRPPLAPPATLYFDTIHRTAERCWERDGVMFYVVDGQTYQIPRAAVTHIDGTCAEGPPSADSGALPPLLEAAKAGRLLEVEQLLGRGVDARLRGPGRETALHWAGAYGFAAILDRLTDRGADPGASDATGGTALHYAAAEGQTEVVKYLLNRRGVDLFALNADQMTPLHFAAAGGHQGAVEWLLTRGGARALDIADASGSTPLHLAAAYGHTPVVLALLAAGADVNAEDEAGLRASDVATANGHAELAGLLKAREAKG
jgi:ankyrin repeat protein